MLKLKSFGLFLIIIVLFLGWQMVDQVNALAARIGLPVSPKLSIADQYVLS